MESRSFIFCQSDISQFIGLGDEGGHGIRTPCHFMDALEFGLLKVTPGNLLISLDSVNKK